jgi:DNA-binding transcriptional LysR family regulator
MNFKALRAFQMIAERGSLSAAASDLCLSQPAVSRLIAMLETELDMRLFDRTGRGLSMTREGALFYETTRHILAAVEEIPRIAKDIQAGDRHFHLLTTPRIAQAIVSPALSLLRTENERLHCRVDVVSHADLERALNASRFDLAITALPLAPTRAAVETTPLFKVRVEAVVQKHHPLARQPHLTAADLAGENLIGPWQDALWRQDMSELLPENGAGNHCTETRSALLACQMANDGVGIAFLDRLSARGLDLSEAEFKPLAPAKWTTFGYVNQRGKAIGPYSTRFINAVKRTVAQFAAKSASNGDSVCLEGS